MYKISTSTIMKSNSNPKLRTSTSFQAKQYATTSQSTLSLTRRFDNKFRLPNLSGIIHLTNQSQSDPRACGLCRGSQISRTPKHLVHFQGIKSQTRKSYWSSVYSKKDIKQDPRNFGFTFIPKRSLKGSKNKQHQSQESVKALVTHERCKNKKSILLGL